MTVPQRGRVEFIDFGKGFAILTIVIWHYFGPYTTGLVQKAMLVGGSGVHLFFVASGFGLALSRRNLFAGSFYARRFPHLLAPYYLVVFLTLALNSIHPYFGDASMYAFAGHVLLFKMFDERIVNSLGYQFWFISTIVQFYLVYPLLDRALDKLGLRRFALLAIVVSAVYSIFVATSGFAPLRVVNSFFLQYLWEFALGMVMARDFSSTNREWWDQRPVTLLALAVSGMGLMAWLALSGGAVGRVLNDIPASIGYCAFCAFLYKFFGFYARFVRTSVIWLGKMSYELYLLHVLVFLVVADALTSLGAPGSKLIYQTVLTFPLALAVSRLYAAFNHRWLYPALARIERASHTQFFIPTKR